MVFGGGRKGGLFTFEAGKPMKHENAASSRPDDDESVIKRVLTC
jgi:hypothetical protein